jgi:hypothetical protein
VCSSSGSMWLPWTKCMHPVFRMTSVKVARECMQGVAACVPMPHHTYFLAGLLERELCDHPLPLIERLPAAHPRRSAPIRSSGCPLAMGWHGVAREP